MTKINKYQISSSQHYKLSIVKAETMKEAREKAEKLYPNRENLHIGKL